MRDLRRMGVEHYRRCFEATGEAGLYVLKDLERFCEAEPEQITFEALLKEQLADRDLYLMHCAKVMVYRHIRSVLNVTDEELEQHYQELLRRTEGGMP